MFSMKSVYIIKGLGIVAEGDFRYPRTELTLTPDDFTMEVYEYKWMEDTWYWKQIYRVITMVPNMEFFAAVEPHSAHTYMRVNPKGKPYY